MRTIVTSAAVLICALLVFAPGASLGAGSDQLIRSLDGSGNNARHSDWGQAGEQYLRVGPAKYADDVGTQVSGPSPRYVSNRIFNDVGQNIFSENDISQWGWAWGQFIDHDIGLRDERELATEHAPMPFLPHSQDALESFTNDFGVLDFFRTPADTGTGVNRVQRQQINTLSSFIDASQVYGVTQSRLDWLRTTATSATMKLSANGYLPRRGNDPNAPVMDLMGPLGGHPDQAAVAGDVRANENIALTAIQTLFVREHNRIVRQLPSGLSQELKFQIARRVVGAEIERITYNEFLPTLGVDLDSYRGYNPSVNPTLGNEFAAMGYRAHSMIHGEFEPTVAANFYSAAQLDSFRKQGIVVEDNGDGTITLVIPLSAAFGTPGLLEQVGEGQVLGSLGEHQYKNDEQIDNALRSVLFQVPKPGTPDPSVCGTPVINPACFSGVADLGADDVQRGRDHGIPSYNAVRQAFGLRPISSFTELTGESTDRFPNDRLIDSRNPLNDPNILDFVQLRDINGNVIPLDSPDRNEDAVVGIRRTTLAARLKAIYGDVSKLDAFVGMVSEKHVARTEFGRLQLAIWKKQFEDLRDGDRFFYRNDDALNLIESQFGISSRHTLAEIVKLNTGITIAPNAFEAT